MTLTFSSGRVVCVTLLAVALTAFSANADTADERDQQISALEKQIAELQAKLKNMQTPRAPMPREVVVSEPGLPASWVNKFQWRSVGPATMGGRVTSIAVFEADPTIYWVATASGGLLKTTNNGMTFEHQFDREATVSVGAVAVAPSNKEIVWVGTGEANPRNSVSFGDGVYKSIDGGKTWKNMGLKTSYQIGDIVVHPTNPEIVYVGALGRLYGSGGERGLFKTEDGGKTWKSVLTGLDDKTGVIDIALSPSDPNTLLVATWERERDAFDSFRGDAKEKTPGGTDEYAPSKVHAPGGAIYKSTDGGKTFTKLAKGLPKTNLGRVGFEWSRKDPKTAYAIIDTEKAGMGKPAPRVYVGMQSETEKGAVKVTSVTAGAPAGKAGLKEGDILTAIAGKEVKSYEAMIDDFRERKPGEKVKFSVTRGKDKLELEITFGTKPEDRPVLGVVPMGEAEGGVTIGGVSESGPAVRAGLKPGDIILAIDDKAVKATADLGELMATKKAGDKVKLAYLRGKTKNTLEVELASNVTTDPARPHAMVMGGLSLGGQRANIQDQQGAVATDTGGLYKTTDGGENWTRLNSFNPRPFYFSVVRVDPTDENTLYILGIDLHRSTDGGKTFKPDNINKGVHSDQHAMWINPKDGRHMILGTDGGFYVSYDKAANWDHMGHAGAYGQFYHVTVDNRTPYRIYGGLQDNGSWSGPSRSERWPGPINADWQTVSWGDGFVCRVDPNDPDVVYSESQDGNILRTNLRTGAVTAIRPQSGPGLQPFRFNWNTPFILSAHNSSIFYSAGNYVFRSVKRGTTLQAVSPEITLTKRGTGTALSESPRNPDIVWAGTDDGGIWVTKDGCKTWKNVSDKFNPGPISTTPASPVASAPGGFWVTSIEASKYVDGRCYVVFDAHRSNDDQPHVFVTEDFGETWKSLKANLPVGSTRVLREDIVNQNLLYLGTEFGCYASIDRGGVWTRINGSTGLPTVAVHEFAQPTTANDLVVATHGRSVWVLDVTPLRQLTTEVVKGKTALLSPSAVIQWKRVGTPPFFESTRAFYGQNGPRGANIDYVIGKKAQKAGIKILDVAGKTVAEFPATTEPGYYRYNWDLRRSGGPVRTAASVDYRIVLTVDGTEHVQTLTVEPDPNTPRSGTSTGDTETEVEIQQELEQAIRKDD
jgi:photosystem II stability/assembly factor-like uncharacterized protein